MECSIYEYKVTLPHLSSSVSRDGLGSNPSQQSRCLRFDQSMPGWSPKRVGSRLRGISSPPAESALYGSDEWESGSGIHANIGSSRRHLPLCLVSALLQRRRFPLVARFLCFRRRRILHCANKRAQSLAPGTPVSPCLLNLPLPP